MIYDPKSADLFLRSIREGNHKDIAVYDADLTEAVIDRWLSLGEQNIDEASIDRRVKKDEYGQFYIDYRKSLAFVEKRLSTALMSHAMEDPKWAHKLLLLRHPERYSEKVVETNALSRRSGQSEYHSDPLDSILESLEKVERGMNEDTSSEG